MRNYNISSGAFSCSSSNKKPRLPHNWPFMTALTSLFDSIVCNATSNSAGDNGGSNCVADSAVKKTSRKKNLQKRVFEIANLKFSKTYFQLKVIVQHQFISLFRSHFSFTNKRGLIILRYKARSILRQTWNLEIQVLREIWYLFYRGMLGQRLGKAKILIDTWVTTGTSLTYFLLFLTIFYVLKCWSQFRVKPFVPGVH